MIAEQGLTLSNMTQNLRDQRWVFDAGDHPQLAATFGAGFNINRKHPPEALSPSHRRGWVVGVDAPGSLRHNVAAGKPVTGMALAETLTHYSERGEEYVKTLTGMMRVNELYAADQAAQRPVIPV